MIFHIYRELLSAGVPIDHHESDLYAKVTDQSAAIVARYPSRDNVRTFRHAVTGEAWYDIPFAYEPYWEARRRKT